MRVGIFPMKVGHGILSSLSFIKRQKPRVFSMTEMDMGHATAIPAVKHVFGRLVRIFSKDLGGHSMEIPIVLRLCPWVKVLDYSLTKLSEDGGDKVGGMGNDRYLARLKLKVWRKVWVHYATHTNAGVQKTGAGEGVGKLLHNEASEARWKVYQVQMQKIEELVQKDVDDESIDVTTLGGDMNMLPIADGLTEYYSPHKMFERLGMAYQNTRVVYLAVHGARFTKIKIYPPGKNGWLSDHGGLMGWMK